MRAEGRHRNFAGLAAVNDLTFQLEKGAIHGLIGPNGAGKTTILNVISGFYKPGAGRILFEGERYQHAHCTVMSEMGHEETLAPARLMSVPGGRADIAVVKEQDLMPIGSQGAQ